MHELFGVMVSDAVSKNNLKLATGALHSSLSEYWKIGLPMCVGHDAHRLVGWSLPVGIHLEPGMARPGLNGSVVRDARGQMVKLRIRLQRKVGERPDNATPGKYAFITADRQSKHGTSRVL
jgi:hypothetical protein